MLFRNSIRRVAGEKKNIFYVLKLRVFSQNKAKVDLGSSFFFLLLPSVETHKVFTERLIRFRLIVIMAYLWQQKNWKEEDIIGDLAISCKRKFELSFFLLCVGSITIIEINTDFVIKFIIKFYGYTVDVSFIIRSR